MEEMHAVSSLVMSLNTEGLIQNTSATIKISSCSSDHKYVEQLLTESNWLTTYFRFSEQRLETGSQQNM
jgi:hypothetical protein